MNENITATLGWDPTEGVLRALRQRLEDLQTRHAADPDGELSELDRTLRLKRGCRRG